MKAKKEIEAPLKEKRLEKIIEIKAKISLHEVQYPLVQKAIFPGLSRIPSTIIIYKFKGWFPDYKAWREIDNTPDVIVYECRSFYIKKAIEWLHRELDEDYPFYHLAFQEQGSARVEIWKSKERYHVFLFPCKEKDNVQNLFSVVEFEDSYYSEPKVLSNNSLWSCTKTFESTCVGCDSRLTRLWVLTSKKYNLVLSYRWVGNQNREYQLNLSNRIRLEIINSDGG